MLDNRLGIGVVPRIMYLPTGQPVVVVARRPAPPPAAQRPQPLLPSASRTPRTSMGIDLPPSPTTAPNSDVASTITDTVLPSASERAQPPPLIIAARERPRRKPLQERELVSGHADSGPGPDYEPDEAERGRATRGEAQAQVIAFDGTDTAGPTEKFLAEGPGRKPRRRNST